MLIELAAENIAIMDKVEVRFGPGFTAITGETGAGKSLLIDAISLCLGERADSGLVRKGATSASVRAVFDPPASTRTLLDDLGYSIGEEALFLQRDLAAEGKSACRINGKTAPLSVLKQIGDSLADLHGQHEHQSLLNSTTHLELLDAWIGEKAFEGRRGVAAAWQEIASLRAEIEQLSKNVEERERMLDVLQFQVSEIEDIGVKSGEIAELQSELRRLEASESLSTNLESAKESLFNADTSAKDLVSKALHELEAAATLDAPLAGAAESLRAALIGIEDACEGVKAGIDRIEYAPERIELIAGRLDEYSNLKRKYGDSEDKILEFLDKARTDLDRLHRMEALSSDAAARLAETESRYDALADALSVLRRSQAANFANRVEAELKELGMPAAKFASEVVSKPPGPDGTDQVHFGF
jgi:DNA repair protein RecN (Recombination protein N)